MNDMPAVAEHLRTLAQQYHDTHRGLEERYQHMTAPDAFLAELRQRETMLVDRFRSVQHQLLGSMKDEDLEKVMDLCRAFDEIRLVNQFAIQTIQEKYSKQ
jgi:hypothetical protein